MTTLEESIALMDWLRDHWEIGLECMNDTGQYEHLPEYCKEETRDYSEWEHDLRAEGPSGERAYALIRRAAEQAWKEKHGDHWTRGATITKRVSELLSLSDLRQKVKR